MRLFAAVLLATIIYLITGALFTPLIAYEQNTKIARTIPPLLTCSESTLRIQTMLDLHFQYKDLSEELFQRTIKKMAETMDPNKIFFHQSDVDLYLKKSSNYLGQLKKNNCAVIFELHKTFIQRGTARLNDIARILNENFDEKNNEFINIKEQKWLNSDKEIYRELKKKIKVKILSEKTLNNNEKNIKNTILNYYKQLVRKTEKYSREKLFAIFLNSFALALDPHSAHMLPADHDSFVIHISNRLEGIGAQLIEKDGNIYIRSLIKGGVAQKDGRLKVKDRILAVDSGNGLGLQDLSQTDMDNAVNSIRGKKGTTVKLLIQRKEAQGFHNQIISLVRDEIELQDDTVKSSIIETNNGKIGLIKIPTFYTDLNCKIRILNICKGVTYDTEKEIKKLTKNGIKGIIIDLRNNGGGDFPESIRLTGLFIPAGTVVQTIDREKVLKRIRIEENSWRYKGPMVVLINKLSASASEIFAAAIQDYGRGIIVGDKSTYGKATVQIVQEIPGTYGRKTDGAIKVTQSKFYRVTGMSNQKYGVQANINIPSLLEEYEVGEEKLDYSLAQDNISPVKNFKPLFNFSEITANLISLSKERLEKSKNYKELLNKIREFRFEKNKLLPINNKTYKKIEEHQNVTDFAEDISEQSKPLTVEGDLQLTESIRIFQDLLSIIGNKKDWTELSSLK